MSETIDTQALLQQVNESKRKIELIRTVTFEINKVLNLTDKLNNILTLLHEHFFINYSMILLLDTQQENLVVQSSYGYEQNNYGFTIPMGTGIIGLAAQKKLPINITGIRRKRDYLSATNIKKAETTGPGLPDPESQIAIPLVANNELVAVLLAESYNVSVFSKDDEAFLITLSQAIAVSIQNSMLFDRMEALIAKRTEELQRSNNTKDRLFSVISHDLRGPITSFYNIARLVNHYNRQNEREKIEQLSNRIDQSVDKLNTLLDNLLNWALTQTKELKPRPEHIDMVTLLNDVKHIFDENLEVKSIALELKCSDGVFAFADYNLLATVIRNLVSNAIKYTSRGGKIVLHTFSEEHYTVVEIEDNGVGIPPDKLSAIFLPHEKKNSPGTENEKGTGLGLLVAYEFMQLNNGSIQIKSVLNEGTRVTIKIPAI